MSGAAPCASPPRPDADFGSKGPIRTLRTGARQVRRARTLPALRVRIRSRMPGRVLDRIVRTCSSPAWPGRPSRRGYAESRGGSRSPAATSTFGMTRRSPNTPRGEVERALRRTICAQIPLSPRRTTSHRPSGRPDGKTGGQRVTAQELLEYAAVTGSILSPPVRDRAGKRLAHTVTSTMIVIAW